MKNIKTSLALLLLISGLCINLLNAQVQSTLPAINVSLQKRLPSEGNTGTYYIASEIQKWNPSETAIIICDMWDQHWCKGAAERVAEMAPFMNNVISTARDKGILIVHAPSECMEFYKNHPARKLGQKYKSKKAAGVISKDKLASEKDAVWPIDQSDGGCDDTPECKQGPPWPWTRQIDLIEISDKDAISDSGAEIAGLFYKKGIKNVILMGVHTNMCVIGRSFGLRNMVRLGMNVVLMRDMTDTMYDSKQWPTVNHFTGNSLVNEYIETYVCPSIVSTDLTGKKQFRFKDDSRPVVAFLTAENEYSSNITLPEFAHELFLTKNLNCEFAIGKPIDEGDDRYNLENLQILEDADLVVVYIRRRGFEPKKMDMIKAYVNSGKPVLGLRTASHAFDPRIKPELSKNNAFLASLGSWPEFDRDILGGNYLGHTDSKVKSTTVLTAVPGMESHPLLKDVSLEGFTSPSTLYTNQSLRSEKAQVILIGTITDQPTQPVLWTNLTGKTNAIYTSLGSIQDFNNGNYRQILKNCISYLLNLGADKTR
jgi:nicotinamidase-related amidase/type 1 glutamine amidotransferase